MKSKILLWATLQFAGISVLLSGCAMHHGYMANSTSLSTANFSYVERHIQGRAKASYVLGIGGRLKKNALVDLAKENMLRKSPLESNQALANLTVNFRTSGFLGITKNVECIITADVVEFE